MEIAEVHWLLEMVNSVNAGMVVIDRKDRVQLWNGFMENFTGIKGGQAISSDLYSLLPDLPRQWLVQRLKNVFESHHRAFTNWEIRPYLTQLPSNRPITGPSASMYQNITILPLTSTSGEVDHACLIIYDVTETAIMTQSLKEEINERKKIHDDLMKAHAETQEVLSKLKEAHSQLLQSEKMASIGQLAAGVAHEINNPIGYVNSNVNNLKGYIADMMGLLQTYDQALADSAPSEATLAQIKAQKEQVDFEFLSEDIENLINESLEGTGRVKTIVQDLKDFSRVGEIQWETASINHGIESTLNICHNEIKYKAVVEKSLGELPLVECIPSQLNQVILNILVNAAQAIEKNGVIKISTVQLPDQKIRIRIADNGKGIKPEALQKIFDPFFTTKPVGKGTGLGLSIAYGIINRHHGEITADSTLGEGTTFTIDLPITQTKEEPPTEEAASS